MNKLESLNVKVKSGSGCCNKNKISIIYVLPKKINLDILSYFSSFGEPSLSFEKTSVLKYDSFDYTIIAVRKFNDIKVIVKNNNIKEELISKIEDIIIRYVE
jgi:hypothetical protein